MIIGLFSWNQDKSLVFLQIKMRYANIDMYLLFKTLCMSKQSTGEEDLIILSEDTQVHDTLEDLTLDIPESWVDSDIITFWEEEISLELDDALESSPVEEEIVLSLDEEVSEEMVVEETEEAKEETEQMTSDFSFDLTTDETVSEAIDIKEEVVAESADLDFGGFDLTSDDNVSDTSPMVEAATAATWVASMNSILEDTVAKLEARKEAIAGEKSGKTAKVAELKAEIKKLEEEVLSLEWEIEGLDEEATKISSNIDSLQDMKLGGEDIAKEHNSNRVKK